jgi:hypothetical protein
MGKEVFFPPASASFLRRKWENWKIMEQIRAIPGTFIGGSG